LFSITYAMTFPLQNCFSKKFKEYVRHFSIILISILMLNNVLYFNNISNNYKLTLSSINIFNWENEFKEFHLIRGSSRIL